MEENIILGNDQREQPDLTLTAQPATAEQIIGDDVEVKEGSLGKFKDVESLTKAYTNLQAEFTRKSQKLSTALRQLEKVNDKTPPVYESENWQTQVEEFLNKTPKAKQFATEISEAILSDNALASSPAPLEFAWAKVLASKYRSPESLIEDDNFINEHVINNKKITELIVQNYLSSLQQNRSIPFVSNHTGASVGLTPKNKPKSLNEAKEMAKSFFKI